MVKDFVNFNKNEQSCLTSDHWSHKDHNIVFITSGMGSQGENNNIKDIKISIEHGSYSH